MSETDFASFNHEKTPGDRTFMNVLYGMHAIAPFTLWTLSLLALLLNYFRRADEHDPLYVTHHNYMIRTFWWTLLWLVVAAPLWLLIVVPGYIAYMVIGIWYIYRFVRGWIRFSNQEPPPA